MTVDSVSLNEDDVEDRMYGFCRKIIFVDKEKGKRRIGHTLKEDSDAMHALASSGQRRAMVKLKFIPQKRKNELTLDNHCSTFFISLGSYFRISH